MIFRRSIFLMGVWGRKPIHPRRVLEAVLWVLT